MFYDEAKIFIQSGNGGDGMIGFRREKFAPMGGPNGGDGGKGGDIVFMVNVKLSGLGKYHRQVHFKAGHGEHGGPKNQTGALGETLQLEVPAGTVIRNAETGELIADLTDPQDAMVIVKGGRGGKGNTRFVSSTNQAPRLAERGEPGQSLWVTLELKLIADVGIVGVPNAGKSTLLSVVSAAHPKIADYPFTTLHPSLGVVQLDNYETMVFADIPGLIEGASQGAGLGHDFLRHIERTRLLIHLLDGNSQDPIQDWAMINQELSLYDVRLEQKPQLVVLNKLDLPDAQTWEPMVAEHVSAKGYPFTSISAVTGKGVKEMLYQLKQMLVAAPPAQLQTDEEEIVIRPELDDNAFTIEKLVDGWRIHGKRIERVAAMTYWEFDATVLRFQKVLESMGITEAMEKAGVQVGDMVYIGDEALEWGE